MTDHSEFPWGPQYEPGLLTPFGVIGWVVASALLLALLLQLVSPMGRRTSATHLSDIHKIILAAARFALKQDEFGILRGADVLRRVIKHYLSPVIVAGGGLGKQLKALDAAMGEGDEKKDEHGKDAHGKNGHGKGGHGAHVAQPAHAGAEAAGAVAHTVQGHSITVNVGGDAAHGEEHGEDDKPVTLEEQLVALRKAVREFEAWWSDKPGRLNELRAAQEALTIPKKPDPALMALFEEKK
ncbi:MAG: hypothetical protein Q8L23_06435 [Caulobacter sp.]|nr:hypothetical protein [Caulobacter sp.]